MISLIRDHIQAFVRVKDQRGWRSGFSLSVQYLVQPFFRYRRAFFLRKSLREPLHIPRPKVQVTIRQATLNDRALLETIASRWRVRRFLKKLEGGEICFVAIREQRVVAFRFAGFAGTPSTEDAGLNLGARETYIWGAYTLPQYRGRYIGSAIHVSMCRFLVDQGYELGYALVHPRNAIALSLFRKLRYQVVGTLTQLGILKWTMSRYTPARKPLHGRAISGRS